MGSRQEIWHQNGIVEIIDTRTIEEAKQQRLSNNQELCSKLILEQIPLHKQINAALGLFYNDAEIKNIQQIISKFRNTYKEFENKINHCSTLEEIDTLEDLYQVFSEEVTKLSTNI